MAAVSQEPNEAVKALREWGAARAAWWENPTRGRCGRKDCPEEDCILHEAEDGVLVCADHYRRQSNRDKPYPCDTCGEGPAFRDPMHRRDEMLCMRCHNKDGYVPGERAMVTKLASRQGVEHPMARRVKCIAAGHGTDCGGEIKQRGKLGTICNKHHDPVKWLKNRTD